MLFSILDICRLNYSMCKIQAAIIEGKSPLTCSIFHSWACFFRDKDPRTISLFERKSSGCIQSGNSLFQSFPTTMACNLNSPSVCVLFKMFLSFFATLSILNCPILRTHSKFGSGKTSNNCFCRINTKCLFSKYPQKLSFSKVFSGSKKLTSKAKVCFAILSTSQFCCPQRLFQIVETLKHL